MRSTNKSLCFVFFSFCYMTSSSEKSEEKEDRSMFQKYAIVYQQIPRRTEKMDKKYKFLILK